MRRLLIPAFVLLGGCAELPLPLPLQPAVDGVVSETLEVARAPAARQKAALAAAQRDFAADPAPMQRIRLAALLAMLPAPLHDDARALELLEPIVESASPAGRFAAFLAAHIAERQRLAREVDRLEREADRLAKERASAEREHQNAEKERDKREEALRQQLEALRAIERGILEREERLRKKPGVKP